MIKIINKKTKETFIFISVVAVSWVLLANIKSRQITQITYNKFIKDYGYYED